MRTIPDLDVVHKIGPFTVMNNHRKEINYLTKT